VLPDPWGHSGLGFNNLTGIVKRTTYHTSAMYAGQLGSRVGRLDLEAGSLDVKLKASTDIKDTCQCAMLLNGNVSTVPL